MSMYNMLHGTNPLASIYMAMLRLSTDQVGRFRDCYLQGDEIVVYTRNGGGNREDYEDVFEALSQHENYLHDEDDDFDSTYAYIHFSIPEQHQADVTMLKLAIDQNTPPPAERWKQLLEDLEKDFT